MGTLVFFKIHGGSQRAAALISVEPDRYEVGRNSDVDISADTVIYINTHFLQ